MCEGSILYVVEAGCLWRMRWGYFWESNVCIEPHGQVRAKDMMYNLVLKEAVDPLAKASSVHWCGRVLRKRNIVLSCEW